MKSEDRPPRRCVVFLDRDGTIIRDKHYLADPDEVELLDGAVQGLRALAGLGAVLVVVSNQSGVGRGYFTEEDVALVTDRLDELLDEHGVRPAGYYHCPHAPEKGCNCRKPATGLVDQARTDLGLSTDPERCFVIGDKDADVELARNVGAQSILVLTGKGAEHKDRCRPDFIARDLAEAADWIAEKLGRASSS